MSDAENQLLTSNGDELLDRSFDTDKSNVDGVDTLVREGSPDSLNVEGKRTPPTDIPRTVKSRSSYKSRKSSGSNRTSANSGRPKTRARQIKPHENEPFLSVGKSPVERQTPDHEKHIKQKPHNGLSHFSAGRSTPNRTPSGRSTPQIGVYVSPNATTRQANHQVRSPFKQTIYKPDTTPDRSTTPSQDLKEQTALATQHVSAMLAMDAALDVKKQPGKLLKGKLKPLYPVEVVSPGLNHCRGIMADTKWYGASESRTLQRRRQIMNTVPRDILYQRATTVESIHRTSMASSMEDVNDINKINYSVDSCDDHRDKEGSGSSPSMIERIENLTVSEQTSNQCNNQNNESASNIQLAAESKNVEEGIGVIDTAPSTNENIHLESETTEELTDKRNDQNNSNMVSKQVTEGTLVITTDNRPKTVHEIGKVRQTQNDSDSRPFSAGDQFSKSLTQRNVRFSDENVKKSKSSELQKNKKNEHNLKAGSRCKPNDIRFHSNNRSDDDDNFHQKRNNSANHNGFPGQVLRGNYIQNKSNSSTNNNVQNNRSGSPVSNKMRNNNMRVKSAEQKGSRSKSPNKDVTPYFEKVYASQNVDVNGIKLMSNVRVKLNRSARQKRRNAKNKNNLTSKLENNPEVKRKLNLPNRGDTHISNKEKTTQSFQDKTVDKPNREFSVRSRGRHNHSIKCKSPDDQIVVHFAYSEYKASEMVATEGVKKISDENNKYEHDLPHLKLFDDLEEEICATRQSIQQCLHDGDNRVASPQVSPNAIKMFTAPPIDADVSSDEDLDEILIEDSDACDRKFNWLLAYRKQGSPNGDNKLHLSHKVCAATKSVSSRPGSHKPRKGSSPNCSYFMDSSAVKFQKLFPGYHGDNFSDSGCGSDNAADIEVVTDEGSDSFSTGSVKADAVSYDNKTQGLLHLLSGIKPDQKKDKTASMSHEEDIDYGNPLSSTMQIVATSKELCKPRYSHDDGHVLIAPYPPMCFRVNTRPPADYLYYFSYGSDMNADRLSTYVQRQLPSRLWGLLFGFRLVFNKKGVDVDAGGFPNIGFDPTCSVEGCVYLISYAELELLDQCVGYPQHYEHVMFPVWMLNSSDPDNHGVAQYCIPAMMYMAQNSWVAREKITNDYSLSQCLKSSDLLTPAYKEYMEKMASR